MSILQPLSPWEESMMLMKSLRNAALAAMLFTAGVANATVYEFTLSGAYTANWQLDSSREPEDYISGLYFTYFDNEGNFPEASLGIADVSFFYAGFGGGMSIYDYYADIYLMIADGPQLFTGTETDLGFNVGTFALTEYQGTGSYTLQIAEVGGPVLPPADVPEPATGALLLGGLACMTAAAKRRKLRA
jgi:hypothetical protein